VAKVTARQPLGSTSSVQDMTVPSAWTMSAPERVATDGRLRGGETPPSERLLQVTDAGTTQAGLRWPS
jgi:hypothetical protein